MTEIKTYCDKCGTETTSKVVSKEQKQKTSISVKRYRREHAKLKFEYNGEMLSIPEIAEKMNVRQGTLWQRYCRTGSIFLGAKKDNKRRDENEG